MMDLAEYLQAEVDKARSIRKVAKHIGISKTALDNIIKRRLKTVPELLTLEKIATAYTLTVPAVVEMLGRMLGETEKYTLLAREMEHYPWITEEWARLTGLTRDELRESLDYIEWRRRHPGGAPPPQNGDQSTP